VPRDRASKIQILSAKHDGLLLAVDKMFDKFATLQQVQEMIERKYHEKLSCGAVLTYKTRHWKVQKNRIREQKAAMKAIAQLVGEDGLSAGVMALLWQALQTMTPPQLIALQRALDNHQKTELAKEQFALHAEALRLKMRKDRPGKMARLISPRPRKWWNGFGKSSGSGRRQLSRPTRRSSARRKNHRHRRRLPPMELMHYELCM